MQSILGEAKLNYYSLIHGAPLPIIVLDLKMNVKLWNHSAEKMFG